LRLGPRITADGLPLIERVPGIAGAYVATGHSVWGILNAPATVKAMAELIANGVAHRVDLRGFDPSRLPPVEPGAIGVTATNLQTAKASPVAPLSNSAAVPLFSQIISL
jgi:hypothetical protein